MSVVIGSGIVGACCALALQSRGRCVTIVDRGVPRDSASYGNLGGIGVSETVPLAMPGVLGRIPRWLLQPSGPLVIRWRYLPRLAP